MFESSAPARHPDGSLKSAEEMEWIHDPDDDTTILPPPPPSKGTLNSFIRHSGRAVKPTEKIRETASSIPAKRSAVGPPAPAPKKALMRTRNEERDDTTFEALQLLKSAYRQGHISATAQAEFAAPYDNCVNVNEEF
ncbi:hypothetical protein BDR06DRAFT_1011323 [Suillus hirtellus]|nr:hypothetical protein BDR06DRAFT_1011323 [Suillus hirtellus]